MSDDLDRLLRSARPSSGNRHLPLTDRSKRELAELLLDGREQSAPPTHHRSGFAHTLVIALVAVIVVGVPVALSLFPSFAPVTPLAVDFASVGEMVDSTEQAEDQAEAENAVTTVQVWADSNDSSPQTWEVGPAGDVVASGTHDGFDPGGETEAGQYYDAAPTDINLVPEFLSHGQGIPDAATAITLVHSLLLEQSVNEQQSQALIDYLLSLPDLQPLGPQMDRLGRSGIGYVAHDPADSYTAFSIIIGGDSPRILAIAANESAVLPGGEYFAWTP